MELDSDDCLRQVMAIKGVLGVRLVDIDSGLTINAAGREPSDDRQVTAAGVTGVLNAALGHGPFAAPGVAERLDDIVFTAANGYHVVRLVGARHGTILALYVWVDRLLGNLAMAQRRIGILADGLVAAR